jgi:hypothetical protein
MIKSTAVTNAQPAQIAEDMQQNDISCYKLPMAASPDEADETSCANEVLQVWLTRFRLNLLFCLVLKAG